MTTFKPPPISRLPPEILSEVFVQCLPRHPTPNGNTAPLLLTEVCKSWRDNAFHTHSLWSSIKLVLSTSPEQLQSSLFTLERSEKFGEWITRSGDLPLHIHLDLSLSVRTAPSRIFVDGLSGDGECYRGLYDAVAKQANRWHSLILAIPERYVRHILSIHSPSLQSFQIIKYGSASDTAIHFDPSNFPLLSEVNFASFRTLLVSPIPNTRIRTLCVLRPLPMQSCLDLMAASPLLEQIEVMLFRPVLWEIGDKRVEVPRLKRIILKTCVNVNVRWFLDHLVLPSLEDLAVVDGAELTESHHFEHISQLLERSRCNLECFSHEGNFHKGELQYLVEFFQQIPRLKSLRLSSNILEECLFEKLSASRAGASNKLLPQLETLIISHPNWLFPRWSEESACSFAAVINSRVGLRSISVSSSVWLEPKWMTRFETLIQGRLEYHKHTEDPHIRSERWEDSE